MICPMLPVAGTPLPISVAYPVMVAGFVGASLLAPAMPQVVPVVLGLACCVPGWLQRQSWSYTAPLVLLALIGDPGPTGLIAWSLLALVLGLVLDHTFRPAHYDRTAAAEIANSVRERDALADQLARYPLLLDASLELSRSQDESQLATVLAGACRRLVADLVSVQVFTGDAFQQQAHVTWGDRADLELDANGDEVRYVSVQSRDLIRRDGDLVVAAVPLRGDRRAADGEGGRQERVRRGVLVMAYPSRGLEDQLIIDLIHALGRLGGLALASVDLLAEARSLALYDDLTGLFGRHEFLRRLHEAAASTQRKDGRLGVVMLDMDHLKRFNDSWGHAAGDQALVAVAEAIRSALPSTASACRYGGEEFLVAVPDGDAGAAGRLAESILTRIRAAQPLPEHPAIRLTASLGWAELKPDEAVPQLLARIDTATYAAKSQGRDRVVAADA